MKIALSDLVDYVMKLDIEDIKARIEVLEEELLCLRTLRAIKRQQMIPVIKLQLEELNEVEMNKTLMKMETVMKKHQHGVTAKFLATEVGTSRQNVYYYLRRGIVNGRYENVTGRYTFKDASMYLPNEGRTERSSREEGLEPIVDERLATYG